MTAGQYRMIATDLDSTLLRPDKTLSDYTLEILSRCRAKGILLMFATARPLRTIAPYIDAARPDAVAAHNGAVVLLGGKEIARHGIGTLDRDLMLSAFARAFPGRRIAAEIDETLYANFDAREIWTVAHSVRTDFSDLPEVPADKLLIDASDPETLDAIEAQVQDPYYVKWIERTLAMIMRREAEKSRAVREVAACAGIGLGEVVAFGDDVTDIPMLAQSGMGVAVENALDEVKAAARAVCPSCGEDGVARWLEENVL